jgi:hypothetical protein
MRPLKLTNAALLQTLKNAILEQNRLEFQKMSKFWPSKWRFFKNVALEPIWVGHGCFMHFNYKFFDNQFLLPLHDFALKNGSWLAVN